MIPPIIAMHIPDGFLNIPVSAFGWLLSLVLIGVALRLTRDQLGERQIPLMGILAAFVFAAQMINFPVAGGTSGHLIGGALVAILLGPWAAVLVMTCVVGVQALIYQDGGVVVLGFNLFNMAVISPFVGYTVYSLLQNINTSPMSNSIRIGVSAWLSTVVASVACALELAVSGTSSLNIVLPAMFGVHILIGIGEALITVGAWNFIYQTRSDLVKRSKQKVSSGTRWIVVGICIALAITLVSPLADPNPDGLERVAEDSGFLHLAQNPPYEIIPDYQVSFVDNEALATILAGMIGVCFVAGLGYSIARLNKARIQENVSPDAT